MGSVLGYCKVWIYFRIWLEAGFHVGLMVTGTLGYVSLMQSSPNADLTPLPFYLIPLRSCSMPGDINLVIKNTNPNHPHQTLGTNQSIRPCANTRYLKPDLDFA